MCCAAAGEAKPTIFTAPIIVLCEMSQNSDQYPDLPYRSHPISLVVTPRKGLSGNIVGVLVLHPGDAN